MLGRFALFSGWRAAPRTSRQRILRSSYAVVVRLIAFGCLDTPSAPEESDGETEPVGSHASSISEENLAATNLADANMAGTNLAGTNIAGTNITGFNLAGFNLTNENLNAKNLGGVNLSGA